MPAIRGLRARSIRMRSPSACARWKRRSVSRMTGSIDDDQLRTNCFHLRADFGSRVRFWMGAIPAAGAERDPEGIAPRGALLGCNAQEDARAVHGAARDVR